MQGATSPLGDLGEPSVLRLDVLVVGVNRPPPFVHG